MYASLKILYLTTLCDHVRYAINKLWCTIQSKKERKKERKTRDCCAPFDLEHFCCQTSRSIHPSSSRFHHFKEVTGAILYCRYMPRPPTHSRVEGQKHTMRKESKMVCVHHMQHNYLRGSLPCLRKVLVDR